MIYDAPTQEPWWQAELDAIAPPGGNLSWLRMTWVAGDEWEGEASRWCVYQMVPARSTPEMILRDLKGPSPRVRGRYDQVLREFVPDPNCNVSLLQWQLYRDTGCWGRNYWIVQGTNGGHRAQFNRTESVISQMHGGPKEPPLIGELAFAKPDSRTFTKLAQRDRVRQDAYLWDRMSRHPGLFDAEDLAEKERMSGRIWEWLASQVSEAVQENPAGARAIWESGRNASFDQGKLEAALVGA